MQYGTTPLLEFKYIGKQYSSVSTIDSVAIDTNIPLSKKIYWTVVYDENSAAEPWADSVSYAQDFKYSGSPTTRNSSPARHGFVCDSGMTGAKITQPISQPIRVSRAVRRRPAR